MVQEGFVSLGVDGVMRSFDSTLTVVDAMRLTPAQIGNFWKNVKPEYRGPAAKFVNVDGWSVPEAELFEPGPAVLAAVSRELVLAGEGVAEQQSSNKSLMERQGGIPVCSLLNCTRNIPCFINNCKFCNISRRTCVSF